MQSEVGVRGQATAHAHLFGGGVPPSNVTEAVYSLKIFECSEWVTVNIKTG